MTNQLPEKILVTGGTGFIGRYVLKELKKKGHKPFVFTRNITQRLEEDLKNEVHLIELDLLVTDDLEAWIIENRPDTIMHLAGATLHDDQTGKTCHDLNYVATTHLLNIARSTGVRRVLLLGTAEEYGNQPLPFREDMESKPATIYGISKARATAFALSQFEEHDLPIVILRIFTVYGYDQPTQMFLNQLITHSLLKKDFNMTDGLQKRDFVYVEDVARAICKAMTAQNVEGRVVNIGSGRSTSLREVAATVWKICETDPSLLHIGGRFKPVTESYDTEADISLAETLLDWKPQTNLENGLLNTIRTMKSDLSS